MIEGSTQFLDAIVGSCCTSVLVCNGRLKTIVWHCWFWSCDGCLLEMNTFFCNSHKNMTRNSNIWKLVAVFKPIVPRPLQFSFLMAISFCWYGLRFVEFPDSEQVFAKSFNHNRNWQVRLLDWIFWLLCFFPNLFDDDCLFAFWLNYVGSGYNSCKNIWICIPHHDFECCIDICCR